MKLSIRRKQKLWGQSRGFKSWFLPYIKLHISSNLQERYGCSVLTSHFSMPWFYRASIPAIGSCWLLSSMVGFRLIYQLLCSSNNTHQSMDKWYRNCIIICLFGCIGCIYSDLAHHLYCYKTDTFLYERHVDNIFALSDALYCVGALSFYLIASLRISTTFKVCYYIFISSKV